MTEQREIRGLMEQRNIIHSNGIAEVAIWLSPEKVRIAAELPKILKIPLQFWLTTEEMKKVTQPFWKLWILVREPVEYEMNGHIHKSKIYKTSRIYDIKLIPTQPAQ